MPGINISTTTRTGPISTSVRESSQAFFVGIALRGPTDRAVLVGSIEEFELNYGGFVSGTYLHSTVQTFFEEGGSQCWIARVSGTGAIASTLSLLNSTTPVITLTAVGAGVWSMPAGTETLSAIVETGTATGTKVVKIYKEGTLIMSTGNCTTNQQIAGKINSHSVAKLLCFATVAPNYETASLAALPSTATAFGDGTDTDGVTGSAPTDTQLAAGLTLFNDELGTGAVACPESVGSTVQAALIAHANSFNRLAFLYPAAGSDPNDGTDYAAMIAITQAIKAGSNAEHVAFFAPWVYVPTSVAGINRMIPPVGYAAAARARAHNGVGPHQPGAGVSSVARFVTGLEFPIGSTVGDNLDNESINAIRIINNTIRIYGARSCSSDLPNFRYITAQDVMNYVVVQAYRDLEDVLFRPIDSRNAMFADIRQRLQTIMEGLRSIGAIHEAFDNAGQRIDYGYSVTCDSSINPVANLVDGLIKARIGFRVTGIGDSIQVDIIKSSLTASVV